MPGRGAAPVQGKKLEDKVRELAQGLGLDVHDQVRVGRRLWGAERVIDLILTDPDRRKSLGIECKFQGTRGTAEEKIPATIDDIGAWPIPGLVVFEGDGFTNNMRSYLISTGKAVEVADLDPWLRLYFGLPLPARGVAALRRRPANSAS
ncbi:MAG: PD-(D/E)XK nuclease superfamily protein [Chloroflexota bacterium]